MVKSFSIRKRSFKAFPHIPLHESSRIRDTRCMGFVYVVRRSLSKKLNLGDHFSLTHLQRTDMYLISTFSFGDDQRSKFVGVFPNSHWSQKFRSIFTYCHIFIGFRIHTYFLYYLKTRKSLNIFFKHIYFVKISTIRDEFFGQINLKYWNTNFEKFLFLCVSSFIFRKYER